MFSLKVKRKALRYIERLDADKKKLIKETLLLLKADPVPAREMDISKLRGYDSVYRIRIGNLRIVYEVLWHERSITVMFVGPRGRAY
jgi:mRNA interferase RelE/StbE